MAEAATAVLNKPAWVDLASSDPAASRDFYTKVFGWKVEVNPDPEYRGYGLAKIDGKDVAGIGGTQAPGQPSAWSVYIGSDDLDGLSRRVTDAGGTVVAPAFDVGDQGRMAVFQDPSGAFISAWQATRMGGFQTDGPNAFSWAELNARGVDKALPFYERIFGWAIKTTPDPNLTYHEFQVDGNSVGGAVEMDKMVPANIPNYWLVYFATDDVDTTHRKALDAGAHELLAPADFPGGRFAIVSDPQGAAFGLMKLSEG